MVWSKIKIAGTLAAAALILFVGNAGLMARQSQTPSDSRQAGDDRMKQVEQKLDRLLQVLEARVLTHPSNDPLDPTDVSPKANARSQASSDALDNLAKAKNQSQKLVEDALTNVHADVAAQAVEQLARQHPDRLSALEQQVQQLQKRIERLEQRVFTDAPYAEDNFQGNPRNKAVK